MKQTFKSKIDVAIALIIPGAFVFILSMALITGEGWIPCGIISFILLLTASSVLNITYTIDENNLLIRAGYFRYGKIDIHQIRKIQPSNSWLSAPAASIDRLEIFYSKYDSVLISPKDKQQFIEALANINPAIEVIVNN